MSAHVGPEQVIGGRYRLVGQLGSGGYGRVWRAYDTALGVEVAIKEVWLPQQSESDTDRMERVARAAREARNAARLRDHPHIVAVHDVVVEDGVPWIVMRLVTGHSLADLIASQGPLPAPRVAEIAVALLQALEAAHSAGVVHRDLKPGNVMLTGDGQVLLTDFGIAVHEADTKITSTGSIIGSVEYMAPERLNSLKDDGASDLFSLGVTLYQAVEGTSPFRRSTPVATVTAVLLQEPAPPQRADPGLARLITALLAKKAEDRPTVAGALAELRGMPAVPAPPVLPTPRLLAGMPPALPPTPPPSEPTMGTPPGPPPGPPTEPPVIPSVTPALPPYAPNSGAPNGPHRNEKRRRTWIIGAAVLAAVLVVSLVISLVVVLGKDNDNSANNKGTNTNSDTPTAGGGLATDGALVDPQTGVSVPRLKDWKTPSLGQPAHQVKDDYDCADRRQLLGCSLGQVAVYSARSDRFEDAIADVMDEFEAAEAKHTVIREGRDEAITVDGKRAYLLAYDVAIKDMDSTGTRHTKSVQIILIDHPFPYQTSQRFPMVLTAVDDAPNSPSKDLHDVVRESIKCGAPLPSSPPPPRTT
ncbi:serine/threonine protein kinase [Streptomycetaceae bacterium NBC_01309]